MRLTKLLRGRLAGARLNGDRGIAIVLIAAALVAILLIVALVIDLSVVRQSRQSNKSAADFAVTAGLNGLETPVGRARPWGGVCTAIEYLKANDNEMTSLSGDFLRGDGQPSGPPGANPCSDTSSPPYTDFCTPGNESTWAFFNGTADGGRLRVEIRSGYRLGSDPDFPEDNDEYSGDAGDPVQDGCDQLAVIIRERDSALFGGVAGSSEYNTSSRSVGRVKIGSLSEETVALLLLEARDCETLVTEGNNTFVRVRATPIGAPTKPGLIQSNSDGTGSCGGSARIIEGSNACPAITGCVGVGPSVVAEDASVAQPGNVAQPGKIGVLAVGGPNQSSVSTPACASATAPTAGCTVASVPINRGTVTRSPVDARYLSHVRTLKSAASNDGPAGYFVAPNNGACNSLLSGPVSTATTGGNPRVYLNCDVSVSDSVTFEDSITDVIITGNLRVQPGGTFAASNVRNLVVRGPGGIDADGVLKINQRTSANCTERFASFPRTETTTLVVTDGRFNGSVSSSEVHLCNTFLFLADGALPSSDGTPPSDNSYDGRINVGSLATLDWKAPNQSDAFLNVGDPLFAQFEDLALWTEYSGNGSPGNAARIGGQGAVVTTGVFFLPNANPFNIGGGGTGAQMTVDAQFIVRKLRLSGTVALEMAPNPSNSVPTPVFEGFGLVR